MKKEYSAIFALLFLAGCVFTQATMLDGTAYLPVDAEDVVLYLDEADIYGDWERIAIIHAQGDATWTRESKMLKAARKRAGKIGANGILIEDINEPSAGAQIAGEILETGSTRRGRMIAIRVFGPMDSY
jgi:hypothetical protein